MANRFVPGHFAPVSWTPTLGPLANVPALGASTLLNIKSHDLKLSVLLHDVTHTGSLGVRGRLAGPLDADGNVQLDLDLDQLPFLAIPLIAPGISGIAVFGLSLVGGIQVPLIVETLHFASAVDKEVMWDFAGKMNSRAGFLVYPALA